METVYSVEGMHCPSCARKIEQGLSGLADQAQVDFAAKRLTLTHAKASLADLQARVSELGSYRLLSVENAAAPVAVPASKPSYYPLVLIVAFISVVSLAGAKDVWGWMHHFMAGFFLVFSFFKLLNLRGFTESYASYDLLAGRWRAYGFIYPFLELSLGLAYLFGWHSALVLWLTLSLMLFSALGVIRSIMRKEKLRCACLGTLLNVPLSTVTLVEDFGMAAMAAVMLLASA